MTCAHLIALEKALLACGAVPTFRGEAWSENCREWVYFDAYLDTARIRQSFRLPEFVRDRTHLGTHDGQEHGLVCDLCCDALMGLPRPTDGKPSFPE